MTFPKPPKPFLDVRIRDLSCKPSICALCAGYEGGEWRSSELANHAIKWLPEFCLSLDEINSFSSSNALELIEKAARHIYNAPKHQNRGEFGELFLHIILRQVHNSIPAIQKIYFKDSVNSTVKGFDAVHVVENDGKFELWIGEVKFYSSASDAIRDVVDEIIEHTKIDYMKNEKMLILNKVDKKHDHYSKLESLLDSNTSIDDLFDCACIPILITYNSDVVKNHNKKTDEYIKKNRERSPKNQRKPRKETIRS